LFTWVVKRVPDVVEETQDGQPSPGIRDPDAWGWVGELSASHLKSAGSLSLDLLLRGDDWVNRRVETIELIDERRVRQQLSVDFRLPSYLPGNEEPGVEHLYTLPLVFLQRRSDLAFFDVRGEDGQSLPILTRQENARITGLMLLTAAQRAIAGHQRNHGKDLALSAPLQAYLAGIPTRTLRRAEPMVADIVRGDSFLFPVPEVAAVLLEDETFLDLLGLCQYCCAVHVALSAKPGERRIVKLSWEGRWDRPGSGRSKEETRGERADRWWRNFQRLAGWRAERRILDTPQVGGAESHHIQIAAPAGVELTGAGARNGPPQVMLPSHGAPPDIHGDPFQPVSSGISRHVHLYVPRAHATHAGLLEVDLRSVRSGLLIAAVFTGLLVTAILALFTVKADNIVGHSETGAAILLLVPAVVAGFLVRPGEHAMAKMLLRGPRIMTTTLGVLPLIAAASLVSSSTTGAPGPLSWLLPEQSSASGGIRALWLGLTIVAFLITVSLAASTVFPRASKPGSDPSNDFTPSEVPEELDDERSS
jgi:hypothetical protein